MRLACAAVAMLAFSAACIAHAAHPLVTEDANTIGSGRRQIEINTDWLDDIAVPSHVGALTFTYEPRAGLDVFANVPAGMSSPSGIGDMSLGAKWAYREIGNTRLLLKPELLLPTGNEAKSLGTGRFGATLNLVSTTTIDRWQWHANLAFAFHRYGFDDDRATKRNFQWRVSGAFQYAVTEKLNLVGDAGIMRAQATDSDRHPVYALTGIIYSPSADLDLDIGIRRNRSCGPCTESGTRQFGAGLTRRF